MIPEPVVLGRDQRSSLMAHVVSGAIKPGLMGIDLRIDREVQAVVRCIVGRAPIAERIVVALALRPKKTFIPVP